MSATTIKVQVIRMGGCFLRAVYGQSRNLVTGEWCVDAVYGCDEIELLSRLKTRFPGIRLSSSKPSNGHAKAS